MNIFDQMNDVAKMVMINLAAVCNLHVYQATFYSCVQNLFCSLSFSIFTARTYLPSQSSCSPTPVLLFSFPSKAPVYFYILTFK